MKAIIYNTTIVDGSGAPSYRGDVGIDGERLNLLPPNSGVEAEALIDGTNLMVTPAFIDAHSHGDLTLASPYATLSKRNQGIVTQIAGQCGVSMFPFTGKDATVFFRFLSGIAPYPDLPERTDCLESYTSFCDWLHSLNQPVNTLSFVGHGTLRLMAMGYENRKPDKGELERMKTALRKCIREGALGLSTGLVYAPCCYADNDEILALLRVVAEEGGFYATHPRNEADFVIEARRESLRLAKMAGVPLCVSHLKAAGRDNWGKAGTCLNDIDAAIEDGLDVLIDCYPYLAGNTSLNVSIPPRYFTKGLGGLVEALKSPKERRIIEAEMSRKSDYDNYILNSGGFSGTLVSSCPVFHDAEGMMIDEYAGLVGLSPFDAYCDILIKNGGLGLGVYFHMGDEDLTRIFAHPCCAVSTDGLIGKSGDNPHPRSFGTMPRAYRMMTAEKRLCTREEAIRRMTGLPADFLRLKGKGFVRSGYDADILLIDETDFCDHATYKNGAALSSGIRMIFEKGKLIYKENKKCN